jgi:hypothetical protein
LNQTIPDDLVVILAKGEEKQQQIRDKASQDAASASARAIGVTAALSPSPSASRMASTSAKITAARAKPAIAPSISKTPVAGTSTSAAKPVATKPAELGKKPAVNMYIQAIPPFKGPKRSPTPSHGTATQTNGVAVPMSPTTARLNANASSFRPNPKANAFNPVILVTGFRIPRY